MAKISKDQQLYLNGMAYGYKIASEKGINALSREIEMRGIKEMPLNVDYSTLEQYVRGEAEVRDELLILSTASAMTMMDDLKYPPSFIVKYLKRFGERCDIYHRHPEELEKDKKTLDKDLGLNQYILEKHYMEQAEKTIREKMSEWKENGKI